MRIMGQTELEPKYCKTNEKQFAGLCCKGDNFFSPLQFHSILQLHLISNCTCPSLLKCWNKDKTVFDPHQWTPCLLALALSGEEAMQWMTCSLFCLFLFFKFFVFWDLFLKAERHYVTSCLFVGLAYQGKDIVFRFII
jgi:hypothetical protein